MRGTEIGSQKEEGKEQRSAITDQRTQDFSGRFRLRSINDIDFLDSCVS